MPQTHSYAASFRSEVSRLAKKVISAQRKVAELQRSLNALTKMVKKQAASLEPAGAEAVESTLGQKWRKHTVRSTRRKLQITQTEMATLLGVSIGSVTGWKTGRTEPRTHWKKEVLALKATSRDEVVQRLGAIL